MSVVGFIRFDGGDEEASGRGRSLEPAREAGQSDVAGPSAGDAGAAVAGSDLQLALAEDASDPATLASRAGLTIQQLADRLRAGTDADWRVKLIDLLDALTPIASRQGRLHAIARLRELADGEEHPETARKSCVDLAKLPGDIAGDAKGANGGESGSLASVPGALTGEQERAVLTLLDRLGRIARMREGERKGE